VLLVFLALLALAPDDAQARAERWPPLPEQKFVAGRAATRADVAAGRAVFAAETGGVLVGKPLKVAIPQYAYYSEGGKRTPAIVVQAEEAQGLKPVGVRLADGKGRHRPPKDIQLLGKKPPVR
jgi:hypothetical protein